MPPVLFSRGLFVSQSSHRDVHGRGSPLCAGERVGLRSSTRSARGARRCHTRCAGVPSRRKFHDCIFARSLSTFRGSRPALRAGRGRGLPSVTAVGARRTPANPTGAARRFVMKRLLESRGRTRSWRSAFARAGELTGPLRPGVARRGKTRGRPAPANFRDVRGDVASLSARLSAAPGLRSRPGAASLVLREPLRQRRAAARPTAARRGARALSVDLSLSVPRRKGVHRVVPIRGVTWVVS